MDKQWPVVHHLFVTIIDQAKGDRYNLVDYILDDCYILDDHLFFDDYTNEYMDDYAQP